MAWKSKYIMPNGQSVYQYCKNNMEAPDYITTYARVKLGWTLEGALKPVNDDVEHNKERRKKLIVLSETRKANDNIDMTNNSKKMTISEQKKNELIDSIHNMHIMLRILDIGSIDYNNARNTLRSLQKQLNDMTGGQNG